VILQSLVALSKGELLDNYKGRSGKFIKGFLLNDKRNKNGWRVTWDSILTHAPDFINHPGTYFVKDGEQDHPDGATYKDNMRNQEDYRVVNIVDVMIDEDTHTLNYVGEVLDDDFAERYDEGRINMTSPGIWPEKYEVVGEMDNGRPMLDVFHWRALHIAYVNDPAYDTDAHTISTCDGDGHTCKIALSANTKVTASDLAPLQEIPLIRKTLNSNYTPCELKSFVAQLLKADTDVGLKLQEIATNNPNEPDDWKLAAAYAYNQQNGIDSMVASLNTIPKVDVKNDIPERIDVPKAKKAMDMSVKDVMDLHVLVEKGLMSTDIYSKVLDEKLGIKNGLSQIASKQILKADAEIENEKQLNEVIAKLEEKIKEL